MSLVLVEREEQVGVCLLNRPQQLNALSTELMDELVEALDGLDRDDGVRCIVVGGSERAFASGADIGEMASASAIAFRRASVTCSVSRPSSTPFIRKTRRYAPVRGR